MDAPHGPQPRQLWLVPGEGETHHALVCDVALRYRTRNLVSYAVPQELSERVAPGVLVRAALGRRQRIVEGWCVGVARRSWTQTLRPLAGVVEGVRPVHPRLVELAMWVSEHYALSPGLTMAAVFPRTVYAATGSSEVCYRAGATGDVPRLSPGQKAALEALRGGELSRAELLRTAGVTPSVLLSLRRRGLVERFRRPAAEPVEESGPGAAERTPEDALQLTEAQASAVEQIDRASAAGAFAALVLFGVPGSGKTEVYVRAMRRVIAAGRQALLLVPEIALATQLIARLARRFDRVAVVHSQRTARQRAAELDRLNRGEVDVVIGTRSAVFAPLVRPGLIIVDEEQESSFKSPAAPFYHARDVAIKRAQLEQVPVVLGSATPSLETWHNAQTRPHYRLIELPQRVPGAQPPGVRVVEQRATAGAQGGSLASRELLEAVEDVLAAGGQAILLHNRRGLAVHLRCERCGLMLRCPRCEAALVLHRPATLRCHRCGHREEAPATCPDDTCRGPLVGGGRAIQRLEQELAQALPRARLLRLDSDTMRRREDYAAALEGFAAGAADVLLGTQMVAKGLDFPNVRLVGVLDADAALSLPDFRAAERAFQLVMQVVGRAGRREGESLALVQCRDAPGAALRAALRLDYRAFAAAELAVRREMDYPPYVRLARIVLSDARAARARSAAAETAAELRRLAGRIDARLRVDDAQQCVIARQRDEFRFEVLLRAPEHAALRRLLREADEARVLRRGARRVRVDVDPIDML